MWLVWMLACGEPVGEGVAAEYWLTLDDEAVFEVRATSDILADEADDVELGLRIQFEDGAPGPFEVGLGGDSEATWNVRPVEDAVLWYPADLDLLGCDQTCVSEVTYTIRPGETGPRELFVAIELLAFGTKASFDAWEHLDLGVQAPPQAAL